MNRKHGERGAALLEFGLAFLIFLSVLYGIMEFGRIVASYNIISGAAREGARYAMVHGSASGSVATASDIQDVVRKWAIGLDTSSVVVTTTWTPGNAPKQREG
jgi:Flp pilus assembly protein TadG